MHDAGIESPSLVEFVTWVHSEHPTFTIELFLRGTEDVRRRVLNEDGELQTDLLTDDSVFHAPTVFQLKAMLYHAGILHRAWGRTPSTRPDDGFEDGIDRDLDSQWSLVSLEEIDHVLSSRT